MSGKRELKAAAKKVVIDRMVEQKCRQAAEMLMEAAKFGGVDGIVSVIDAISTLHATILMRYYPDEDWQSLMRSYHANIGDKIIAVGEALAREVRGENDNSTH